jgi:hypothetical protein
MRISKVLAIIGAITMLAIAACKEPEGIGLEVLPDGEQMPIAWIDTFTVEASTVTYDSVPTTGLSSGTYLIGDFGDPIFGRVQSALYTQIDLGGTDIAFDGAIIDSIVLNLTYAGSYGNTDKLTGTMTFGVYEIDSDLDIDSVYYSNATPPSLISTPLTEHQFRPDLFASIPSSQDTNLLPPSLRIPLDADFGQRILSSSNLASQEVFASEFKGLAILPIDASMPANHGSILYFNMFDSRSRIEVYYHDATEDSLFYNLELDAQAVAAFASFNHEFSTEIVNALGDSTVTGANTLYVQSMAGVRMKLELPHLKELNNLGIVTINKAELVVPLDESVIVEHSVPTGLSVTGVQEDGGQSFLIDFFEGGDYYGGSHNAESGEYVFNIARHLQSILNAPEEEDYGLYIVNTGTSVNARRAVFNGPGHATEPMKLRMTYTIIE